MENMALAPKGIVYFEPNMSDQGPGNMDSGYSE
jgi:hypothetical protein